MNEALQSAVITGPTGAVGLALCRELLHRGWQVYAVCRPGSARAGRLPQHPNLHKIDCDMSQAAMLPGLIPAGADAMFHLAWGHTMGEGRNDMLAQNENIRYTIEHIRAAAKLGCRVFVGAGSQAEYGRVEGLLQPGTPCFPENGYGMAKLCAGQMTRVEAEKLGMRHIWVRILSVYGPGDNENAMVPSLIRALLKGECPALTAGEQLWDYLYSADAAKALAELAEKGRSGGVYPLGSGRAVPLKEYVETLRDLICPGQPLGFGQRPYAPRQVMHLQADVSALRQDTGYAPATPFAEGAAQTIAWYRENP